MSIPPTFFELIPTPYYPGSTRLKCQSCLEDIMVLHEPAFDSKHYIGIRLYTFFHQICSLNFLPPLGIIAHHSPLIYMDTESLQSERTVVQGMLNRNVILQAVITPQSHVHTTLKTARIPFARPLSISQLSSVEQMILYQSCKVKRG